MSEQVAIVTGASRGIGRATAVALGQREWAVCINFRGNAEAADEVAIRRVGQVATLHRTYV